jgi:hypothetical protein
VSLLNAKKRVSQKMWKEQLQSGEERRAGGYGWWERREELRSGDWVMIPEDNYFDMG